MSIEQTFVNIVFDAVIYSEMVLTIVLIFQTGSLIILSLVQIIPVLNKTPLLFC